MLTTGAPNCDRSVRFDGGIQTLAEAGYKIFLEIGPTDTLASMGKRCLPKNTATWLSSLRQERDDWRSLLDSLATLYKKGININWSEFHRDSPRQRVALPTYPFQRQRCWNDSFGIKAYAEVRENRTTEDAEGTEE
ncbi:hypothetical protein [Nostoc sp. GT001]|uniref:hypothetical protein n=1 Tax=Nostoc sp. GT001 TaxID=3056647 RepID=UPI0025AAD2C8|nr:hypothetical protein [Nostoc sp. GT001]MDM9582026.1 hypothetical protein [Nostoc sp. GT001]